MDIVELKDLTYKEADNLKKYASKEELEELIKFIKE